MDIIERLRREFSFTDNELNALNVLKDGAWSVKALSQKTSIPMGRIYSVLHSLEESGLATHTGHPATFTSQPLEERVIAFINHQTESLERKKESLLSALKSSIPPMQVVTDMAEYKKAYFDWISGGDFIYLVQVGYALPLQLFSRSETEAQKLFKALNPDYIPMQEKRDSRKQMWENMRAFRNEKHLIDEKSFIHYLECVERVGGRNYLLNRLSEAKRLMDIYGFQFRIRSGLVASRLVITSKTVVLSNFLNNQIIALKIDVPSIIESYKRLFEQLFSTSKDWEKVTQEWLAAHPVK